MVSAPRYPGVVAATDRRVYLNVSRCGTFETSIITLDAKNGDQVSKLRGLGLVASGPARPGIVADGIGIMQDEFGVTAAVDLESGEQLWQHDEYPRNDNPYDDPIDAVVAATDDVVVVHEQEGTTSTMVALDRRSGETAWTIADASTSQPIAADNGSVVMLESIVAVRPLTAETARFALRAVDDRSGAERWSLPVALPPSGAAIADDVLLFSLETNAVALDISSGGQLWTTPTYSRYSQPTTVVGSSTLSVSSDTTSVIDATSRGNSADGSNQ